MNNARLFRVFPMLMQTFFCPSSADFARLSQSPVELHDEHRQDRLIRGFRQLINDHLTSLFNAEKVSSQEAHHALQRAIFRLITACPQHCITVQKHCFLLCFSHPDDSVFTARITQ